jgi:MFS family permease
VILGAFFWGYACTQIFAGWLADRIGGDACLAVAALSWGVLTLLAPALFSAAYAATAMPVMFIIAVRVLTGACQGACVQTRLC